MRIIEREKQSSVSFEDLLETIQAKKRIDAHTTERSKPFSNGFPFSIVALSIMIVALGVMIIVLKSDISIVKNDIIDLKNFRVQIATLDPKMQISNVENIYKEMEKEKETIKSDLAQLHADLELIKSEPEKTIVKPSKRLRNRPPPSRNRAVKINGEEILRKRTSPQDIYFSDISRATNPDPPTKQIP